MRGMREERRDREEAHQRGRQQGPGHEGREGQGAGGGVTLLARQHQEVRGRPVRRPCCCCYCCCFCCFCCCCWCCWCWCRVSKRGCGFRFRHLCFLCPCLCPFLCLCLYLCFCLCAFRGRGLARHRDKASCSSSTTSTSSSNERDERSERRRVSVGTAGAEISQAGGVGPLRRRHCGAGLGAKEGVVAAACAAAAAGTGAGVDGGAIGERPRGSGGGGRGGGGGGGVGRVEQGPDLSEVAVAGAAVAMHVHERVLQDKAALGLPGREGPAQILLLRCGLAKRVLLALRPRHRANQRGWWLTVQFLRLLQECSTDHRNAQASTRHYMNDPCPVACPWVKRWSTAGVRRGAASACSRALPTRGQIRPKP